MSKIRVISGRAKGIRLKMVPGTGTRPITDRVKENLFNILGDWVIGTRWLDLFAGTGQVGIEALSRGASRADFVDSSYSAIKIIRANLQISRFDSSARVVRSDSFDYMRKKISVPYDCIFVAPPQYQEIWTKMLYLIDANAEKVLVAGGLVIVQIDPSEYIGQDLKHLELRDQRKYGRTMLCFFNLID